MYIRTTRPRARHGALGFFNVTQSYPGTATQAGAGLAMLSQSVAKTPSTSASSSSSGGNESSFWDKILGIAGGGVKYYADVEKEKAKARAAAEVAKASATPTIIQAGGGGGMPSWVLPVGIGAAGLLAVVVLSKKKRK